MGLQHDPKMFDTFHAAAQRNRLRDQAEKPVENTHPTAASNWAFYATGTRPRSTKQQLKLKHLRGNHIN